MRRMDGKQIGLVEGEQQRVFVKVQQMLVGSDQQGNARQRSFTENPTVVLLFLGNELQFRQPGAEPICYRQIDPDSA